MTLCRAVIPLYIGAARAIGRIPNDSNRSPLFLRLFPSPPPPPSTDQSQGSGNTDNHMASSQSLMNKGGPLAKKQTMPNIQKLFPRSLSNLSTNATWTAGMMTTRDSGADLLSLSSLAAGATRGSSFQSQNPNSANDVHRETHYFFFKFGSCFDLVPGIHSYSDDDDKQNDAASVAKAFVVSIVHLQSTLSLAKKLLTKELLHRLDELAGEMFGVSSITSSCHEIFND